MSFDRKPPLPSEPHPDLTGKLPDYRSLGEDEYMTDAQAKKVVASSVAFWAVVVVVIGAAVYFVYQAVVK